MNKKLKLQDFTFLINIIKDQDNWNIQDLADKLTVDLDTLLYMLNIMSEVYSVNGESLSLIHISEPTRPERIGGCGVWL
mgnify:CR=1 FL=1